MLATSFTMGLRAGRGAAVASLRTGRLRPCTELPRLYRSTQAWLVARLARAASSAAWSW